MADILKAKLNTQFKTVLGSDYLRDGYSWCLIKLPEGIALHSQENVQPTNCSGELDQIFTFIALAAGELSIEFALLRKADPADEKERITISVEIAAPSEKGIGSDRFLDYGEALAVYKRPGNELPIMGRGCTEGPAYIQQPLLNMEGYCNLEYMNSPRSALDGSCNLAYRNEACSNLRGACSNIYRVDARSSMDGSCANVYQNEARSNLDGDCAPMYYARQRSELDGSCCRAYEIQPRSYLDGGCVGFYDRAPQSNLRRNC